MKEKKTVKFFRISPPASVNRTENWLKNKTREGYRLYKHNIGVFSFQKCTPYTSEYFMYSGFDSSKGFSFNYHMLRSRYGKSTAKSKINSTNSGVCEIDVKKVDEDYFRFVDLRNRFYFKHYAFLSLLLGIFLSVLFICTFFKKESFYLFCAGIPFFLYALVSAILIKIDSHHKETGNTCL